MRASEEDGREIAENIWGGIDFHSEDNLDADGGLVVYSESRSTLRSDSSDDSEIDTSPTHSVYKKMASVGFARECSAFDGMADTCSHLAETEQREDEDSIGY